MSFFALPHNSTDGVDRWWITFWNNSYRCCIRHHCSEHHPYYTRNSTQATSKEVTYRWDWTSPIVTKPIYNFRKLPNDEICKRNIFTIFQNRKSVDLANPTFRTTCMNETGLENINGNIQDSNVITRYYGQCQEGEFYKRETVAF